MEATCCGKIGSSGKVCVRALGECDIQKHARSRHEGLDAGICIRGNNEDEVYAFPCVSLADLSEDARQDFLTCKVESFDEARVKIDEYNLSLEGKRPAIVFNLPVAKRVKPNIRDQTEALLILSPSSFDAVKSENPEYKSVLDAFLKRDRLMKFLSSAVVENQEDLETLLDRMVDLTGQLGVPPREGPPAIWIGILELRDEVRRLKE